MTAQKTIEERAIHKVNDFFLEHPSDKYAPDLDKNDKTPFIDGEVWVYKDEDRSNDNVEFRVPVQVKGTEKKINASGARYSFQRKWLEYYARDKGLLFFVVFQDKETNDVSIIEFFHLRQQKYN